MLPCQKRSTQSRKHLKKLPSLCIFFGKVRLYIIEFIHLALRHCMHWAAATGLQRALEKKHILRSDLWVACASLVYFIENDNFLCPCKHRDAAFYICTNWLVASVFCFAFSSIKKRNKSKVSRSGAFSAGYKFHSCFLLVSCVCSSFGVAQNCKEPEPICRCCCWYNKWHEWLL